MLHFSLLGLLGIPIGEFFDLDALAEDCAVRRALHLPAHVGAAQPVGRRRLATQRTGHQVDRRRQDTVGCRSTGRAGTATKMRP